MRLLLLAPAALLLAGCAVGPNYKKPDIALPTQFRGAPAVDTNAPSIADTKWQDLFHDAALQKLVETALAQNFNLQIAAERVEQARAQLQSQRSRLFPSIDGSAQYTVARGSSVGATPNIKPGTDLSVSYGQVGVGASWELDLWGRLRRLNEAARAQFFAARDNQLAVRMSLVADVMDTYFLLIEQDSELAIAKQTRDVAQNGLKLTTLRHQQGAATGLDVQQANQLLYTATAQIEATERDIAQTENALNLLLGQAPADIPRGATALDQIARPAALPPGLPVTLLTRRPDIRAQEEQLIAANAQIGAARALYFPQISLSALIGGQSRSIGDLLTGPARIASFTPAITAPIFRAGEIRGAVRLSEAQEREALLAYRQSIFTGLRDVSDALTGYDRTRSQMDQQELLVKALSESTRLSRLRYQGGLDSFLQVLDAERNLFQGQLALERLRLLELQSIVRLYTVLGGGWQ
jgi:multidrug efflux system outer membrane protein